MSPAGDTTLVRRSMRACKHWRLRLIPRSSLRQSLPANMALISAGVSEKDRAEIEHFYHRYVESGSQNVLVLIIGGNNPEEIDPWKKFIFVAQAIQTELLLTKQEYPLTLQTFISVMEKGLAARDPAWAEQLRHRLDLHRIDLDLARAIENDSVDQAVDVLAQRIRTEPTDIKRLAGNLAETVWRAGTRVIESKCRLIAEAIGKVTGSAFFTLYNKASVQYSLYSKARGLIREAIRHRNKSDPHLKEDSDAMQLTLHGVWLAHSTHTRKDQRPYFEHLLDVVTRLVRRYGITDPTIIRIGFAHDTKEKRTRGYRQITQGTQIRVANAYQQNNFNLFRLGVRMLTEILPGHISHARLNFLIENKLLPPSHNDELSEDEAYTLYFHGMRDPEAVYGKSRSFKWSTRYAEATPEFLRAIQLAKCSDRVSNWNDYPWFFTGKLEPKLADKPQRDFDKTFKFFIPLLLNHPDSKLTPDDIVMVYQDLVKTLLNYARIPESQTRAEPLRLAATAALRQMIRAIEDNPQYYYHHNTALINLAQDCRDFLKTKSPVATPPIPALEKAA